MGVGNHYEQQKLNVKTRPREHEITLAKHRVVNTL